MAFGGGLGLELDLARVPVAELPAGCDPDATRLFSESCSRFLVEVAEGSAPAFERALAGLPCAHVGRVVSPARMVVRGTRGSTIADVDVEELRRAHRGTFRG